MGTLFIWVNKAYSRGTVELASRDARHEPKVDFKLLSDVRDMERLKLGFRLGAKTLSDPLMKGWAGTVFPTSYSPRVAKIAGGGFLNAAHRGLFGAMLDYSGPLRSALIHGVVTLGTRLDHLLLDDDALTAFIGAGVGGVWHASGTARTGMASDPLAVTDGQGRVYGLHNLRIVDASLMPTIPRANTNIPTIMMAERIADLMRQQSGFAWRISTQCAVGDARRAGSRSPAPWRSPAATRRALADQSAGASSARSSARREASGDKRSVMLLSSATRSEQQQRRRAVIRRRKLTPWWSAPLRVARPDG